MKDNKDIIKSIDQRAFLLGILSVFLNKYESIVNAQFKDVSYKQFLVLLTLSSLGNHPVTITDLANIMGSSHQNIKVILTKLVKYDLVFMKRDKADFRRTLIGLTLKGLSFSQNNEGLLNEALNKLFTNIAVPDLNITIQTIKTLENNLSLLL